MVFWSFLAGVVTFYCSLGPESLLPNILVSIKPKTKVDQNAVITEFNCLMLSKFLFYSIPDLMHLWWISILILIIMGRLSQYMLIFSDVQN